MASTLFVGIDIGTQYSKVVILEKKIKATLTHAAFFPTPFIRTIKDGVTVDPGVFSRELLKIIPQSALAASTVAVNVSATSITSLLLLLPLLSPRDLASVAVNEAKNKMIPATTPEHVFRSFFLGQRSVNGVNKSEVQVVRTEQCIINQILDLMRPVALTPAFLIPASFSIVTLAAKDKWNKEEDIAFIDIGAATLTIAICREAQLVFTRTITFGFNDILADLVERLALPEDKIRSALLDNGVPQVQFNLSDKVALAEEIMRQKYEATGTVGTEINILELRMYLQPHVERIVQEIRRTLVYNKERWGSRRVEQMYFLGGCSQIKHMAHTIYDSIGGHCEVLTPFKNNALAVDAHAGISDEDMPIFSNAAGMALAISGSKIYTKAIINFLPPEFARKKRGTLLGLIFIIGGALMTAIFLTAASVHMAVNARTTANLRGLERSLHKIQAEQGVFDQYNKESQALSRKKDIIAQLVSKRADFGGLLNVISQAVPHDIYFRKIALTPRHLTINGVVVSDYGQAGVLLDNFTRHLTSSNRFSNVAFTRPDLEKISLNEISDAVDFSLTAVKERAFIVTAEVK